MKPQYKNFLYFALAVVLIWAVYQYAIPSYQAPKVVPLTELTQAIENKGISEIQVKNNELIATKTDGTKIRSFKEQTANLLDYGITPEKVKITVEDPDRGGVLPNLLWTFLPFALVAGLFYLMLRSVQGANIRALSFGKSQARLVTGRKTTFADVAGVDEAKQELIEVVEFLRYPEKFRRLGAEIPKGVLLVGPPGTGKTLLAKAVAGEAGVPFFSISASEFVEMFVGVGAARVRDLFTKAKRNAPAILFIDELDAIGRQRGAGLGGSHDEREQTLNQILVEMDGFETDTRVIVMAATNRPDVLDPALLRPGRFDRRVVIDLPDKKAREEILKIHMKGKPYDTGVNITHIAANTTGFSGADLRNTVNEAAIFAARSNRKEITNADFNQAIEKILLGPERRSRILSDEEKSITACHEAGHAIVAHLLEHTDPVHKVSIVSRGMALGFTWTRPDKDRRLLSKAKFEDELAQLLGGRVAEELIFQDITTGAENDLRRATKIARDMVTVYGMSDKLGPVTWGEREELVFLGRELGEHKTYSDKLAEQIDQEVTNIIQKAHHRAKTVLQKHKELLKKISERLIKDETIEGDEFEKFFTGLKPAAA